MLKLIRARSKELVRTDEEKLSSSESNVGLLADSSPDEGERTTDRQSSIDSREEMTPRAVVKTLMDAVCSSVVLVSSVWSIDTNKNEFECCTTFIILVEVTRA